MSVGAHLLLAPAEIAGTAIVTNVGSGLLGADRLRLALAGVLIVVGPYLILRNA